MTSDGRRHPHHHLRLRQRWPSALEGRTAADDEERPDRQQNRKAGARMPQRKVPALTFVGVLVACLAILVVVAAIWLGRKETTDPQEQSTRHAEELARYRPDEKSRDIRL